MAVNLKELQELIKLCRKQGVLHLKVEGAEILLSAESLFPKRRDVDQDDKIQLDGKLTEEELLFYSAGSLPMVDLNV